MVQSSFARGLEGVVASQSKKSLVDGQASQLYYFGVPVHEFIGPSCFEEVAYLLWYEKFPTSSELQSFREELARERAVSPEILDILEKFPKDAHPMAVLRSMTSILGLFDPEGNVFDPEVSQRQAIRLTAQIPVLIAALYRLQKGEEPLASRPGLSHAADFLYMMHGREPEKEMEKALDTYLILLADHGLNASTFSARVTIATQSDMYSAITAAVGTLKGDLHGSANQRAMEMIQDIGDPGKAESYIQNALENKKKIMGFGHRIYKTRDPRAEAFRKIARELCERSGQQKWMEISDLVEKVMWETKQIPCNVDFFSASVLYVLGFPVRFFTTVFAASRVSGWTAHVIEQQRDNRLIRPSSDYIGPKNQHYPPINQRKQP